MKRLLLPLILFILFVMEGVAIYLLPPSLSSEHMLIAVHWVFMFLVLISLMYDTEETFFAIIYGICFGLLTDVVYTGVLGVYMFIYPMTLYLLHIAKRLLQTNVYMVFIIAIFSLFVIEVLLFFVFSIVGTVQLTFYNFFLYRFIPTMIANMIFLLPLYGLTAGKLRQYRQEQLER